MQAVRDQTACPLEKLQIFVVEGVQFIALGIEHAQNVSVIVAHRHNDLGTSRMKRGQIPKILTYVAHNDGLAGLQGGTAQSLTNRETWIRRWFIAALGQNHE